MNLFVRTGGLLILTPLVVTRLGTAEIAAWYLFSTVIALAALADFGFAPTFSRNIAFALGGASRLGSYAKPNPSGSTAEVGESAGTPNWELVRRLVRTLRFVYALTTLAMALCLWAAGRLAVGSTVAALPDPQRGWMAWNVVWVGAALAFAAGGYVTVLTGLNRVAQSQRVGTLGNSLSTLLSALALLLGADLFVLVSVYQTATLLAALAQRFVLVSEFPDLLERCRFGLDREVFAAIWPPAWRTAAGIAGSTGVAHATSVLVAQIDDTAKVADYLFTMRVFGTLVAFCQAPFYSKIPVFSQFRSRGELATLASSSRTAMHRSFGVFVLGTAACGLFGNFLLGAIHSNARLVDGSFWACLMAVYFLERHHAMHAQIYSTTNHIPFYIPTALGGLANLAIVSLTIRALQAWAVVLGLGISNAAWSNWWNVRISLRALPEDERPRFLRMFGTWSAVTAVAAAACFAKPFFLDAM
ncbi:MAG: hypothetical protein JNL97_03535 [Verrucomicrobiales bacterium]|nr:hypothetical protein [Verrucomicrobiales bacterium]